MREAYVGGRGGSERRQREAVWAVFNSPPKWVRGSRRRQVILSPDGAATGDLTVAESYPHFASSGCHRAGYYITQVGRRPRTKKSSRRGDQGGILGQATKGAVASLGCLHAVTSYVECQAWDFHRRFFIFPSMGATTEKKGCSRQLFLGPPLGPLADRSILCSYHVMFPPVCVPAFLQQLYQDTRSALCRARHNSGHPML